MMHIMSDPKKNWYKLARSRSDLELAALAFAIKNGHTHEEFAAALWSKGAVKWMGKENPTPEEYLKQELNAFAWLFPQVEASLVKATPEEAEVEFSAAGCPYGWGKDRWARARDHGLTPDEVHKYCSEGFRIWGEQLGLDSGTHPQEDGRCILRAKRGKTAPQI
jgi:hypothetical protein